MATARAIAMKREAALRRLVAAAEAIEAATGASEGLRWKLEAKDPATREADALTALADWLESVAGALEQTTLVDVTTVEPGGEDWMGRVESALWKLTKAEMIGAWGEDLQITNAMNKDEIINNLLAAARTGSAEWTRSFDDLLAAVAGDESGEDDEAAYG